jgi:hypothetical protein
MTTSHTETASARKVRLLKAARQAKPGDKWRQRKSGRIAEIVPGPGYQGCVNLKHENGRTTSKWIPYFVAAYDPLTDDQVNK